MKKSNGSRVLLKSHNKLFKTGKKIIIQEDKNQLNQFDFFIKYNVEGVITSRRHLSDEV